MSYLKITFVIMLTILFVITAPALAAKAKANKSVDSDLGYKEGELLVRFAPKENKHQRTKSEKESILSSINGGTIKRSHEHIVPGLTLVKLQAGDTVENALKKFKKTEGILYAEPNYKVKAAVTEPNDRCYSHYQWNLRRISAPYAWDIRHDSNVIVAVIDTGVEYTLPDLAANMWADANGRHGYDFVNDDNDPMDDHYSRHGTSVAGIIGAAGNNGIDMAGVCWKVKIMALKFLGADGFGYISDAIECIDYAVKMGANVLNNSWGGYTSSYPYSLANAIKAADANGVLFVAAAGNNSSNNDDWLFYPASLDCNNIISVMATDEFDNKAYFSNYGPYSVDLAAPGTSIYSLYCSAPGYLNGTSFAAPQVAGACALLWSEYPNLDHLQVKQKIICSADWLPSLQNRCVSGGMLNLYNMFFADCNEPLEHVKNDAKAVKISGGQEDILVTTQDKSCFGAGRNTYYQLGIGNITSQSILARVHDPDTAGFLGDINDIAAGFTHSLFLKKADGSVLAAGYNDKGQLGDGTIVTPRFTPVKVRAGAQDPCNPSFYLKHIIAISASKMGYSSGGYHSLAVDVNHFCYAWGYGAKGQLGQDGDHNNKLTPVKVKSGEMDGGTYLHNIIAVSAGEDQSIALDSNGFVYTWGQNSYDAGVGYSYRGRLGIGSTQDPNDLPYKVHTGQQNPGSPNSALQNIVAISAGWNHCMALEKYNPLDPNYKGRVFTWGWGGKTNAYGTDSNGGRLGNNSTDNSSTPVLVKAGDQNSADPNNTYLTGIVAIAAGESHSMFLTADGYVFCTGSNRYGQLGNGQSGPRKCKYTPLKVKNTSGTGYLRNIKNISAGAQHCLAIDANGTIWAWGRYNNCQLGLGYITIATDFNTPQPLPVACNMRQQKFYFSLKQAVNDANSGDTIEASPGTYRENGSIQSTNKSITIRSIAPLDPNVTAATVIDYANGEANVKFYGNPNSMLAGLTVTNGGQGGVDCNSSFVRIYGCNIRDNNHIGISSWGESPWLVVSNSNISGSGLHGIACENFAYIGWCKIEGNSYYGLYFCGACDGSYHVYNSIIRNNAYGGIYLRNGVYNAGLNVINNWICDNGGDDDGSQSGICLDIDYNDPYSGAFICSNTIADNNGYGVKSVDGQNHSYIANSIVWDNRAGQLSIGCTAVFSSVVGDGNVDDPCFVDDANGNYHIGPHSRCIDTGDQNFVCSWWDIDGENRVMDGDEDGNATVDIGADEYYWSRSDFNYDKTVNFIDFAIFAKAWRSKLYDSNYDPNCDLAHNQHIDYNDLALFCEDWLWHPSWMQQPAGQGWMISDEGEQMQQKQAVTVPPLDVNEVVGLLDEFWSAGAFSDVMTEQEYLGLKQAVIDSLQQ